MQKLRWCLALAGVIPFAIPTVWLVLGWGAMPILGDPARTLSIYGLVIAAFMAGSQWGVHLSLAGKPAYYLALSSNLVAISLWLVYTLFTDYRVLVSLAGGFFWLVCVDYCMYKAQRLTASYWQLRVTVTGVVVACLLIAAAALAR